MQVYNQTTQYIQMDNGAKIHPQANISGVVTIGDNSRIDAFVTITGNVRIGRNVHISTGACIFGGQGVDIGDYSAISVGVKIFTATGVWYTLIWSSTGSASGSAKKKAIRWLSIRGEICAIGLILTTLSMVTL